MFFALNLKICRILRFTIRSYDLRSHLPSMILRRIPILTTLAWTMGFKYIQLELDSKVVLTWLTNHNTSYLTNMMPLICNCRSLLDQDWEVWVQHIYCEANKCANALAKRGTYQQNLLTVYNTYPSFVYVCYVRDMVSFGVTRLYTSGLDVGAA